MNAFQAAGTWTYRIFCKCPMSRSGGLVRTASSCAEMTASTAIKPNQSNELRVSALADIRSFSSGTAWLMSNLDHVIERQERRDDKDHVENNEKPDPGTGIAHRI